MRAETEAQDIPGIISAPALSTNNNACSAGCLPVRQLHDVGPRRQMGNIVLPLCFTRSKSVPGTYPPELVHEYCRAESGLALYRQDVGHRVGKALQLFAFIGQAYTGNTISLKSDCIGGKKTRIVACIDNNGLRFVENAMIAAIAGIELRTVFQVHRIAAAIG